MVENLLGLFLWAALERTLGAFLYHLPPFSLSFVVEGRGGGGAESFAGMEATGIYPSLSPSAGVTGMCGHAHLSHECWGFEQHASCFHSKHLLTHIHAPLHTAGCQIFL